MNPHLSAEEISAWLAGARTPEQEQHARECAECRAMLDERVRLLARFGGVVKDWSAQQLGGTRPITLPLARRFSFRPLRLAAAAAMVAVLTAVPIHLRHRAAERAAEIARQDEALLQQVETEVSRSVPEQMEPLTSLVSWTTVTESRR